MAAWSTQMGLATTHHAVLERMSTSAFVSVVPIDLLTRVLLVFPQQYLFICFWLFQSSLDFPLGQFKGDAYW